MPLADQPPMAPPAFIAPAPECRTLSTEETRVAFERLKQRLPSTSFVGAAASEICGLVRVQFANGSAAYTDPTGRYLLLALALDTHRGSPADVEDAVEQAIEARTTNVEAGGQPLRMSIPTQSFGE